MLDFIKTLFTSGNFMPHGHCYLWNPGVLWLHITSDALIALAYYSIPFTLVNFIRRRRDIPFNWMFLCFALFIVACGTTHLMEIWVIWHPTYWLSGAIKAITAAVSVPTAILLVKLMPQALAIPNPETLKLANEQLEREIADRKRAEAEIRRLNTELEQRVLDRTRELATANQTLIHEAQERQRAEQSSRDNQNLLRAIIDNNASIIYVKDLQGRFLLVNRSFAEVFHCDQQGILGKTDHDLFNKAEADSYRATDERVTQSRHPFTAEEVATLPDGTHTYLSVKCPLFDDAGQPYGMFGISTDITERKSAESKVRQLNAELERRVALRTAELEAANKELEAFSYSVSHDLRAPLRAINGFANIILQDYAAQLPETGRHYLDRVRIGGQQMGQLIDDLLSFSRLSRQAVNRQSIQTNELIKEAIELVTQGEPNRAIEWKVGQLETCHADPVLLRQVWVNLIANAVKYSRGRTPAVIEIGNQDVNGETVYFVRDNGVGFDMKYANKLFGVFQRLHRSEEFEGTGVGLAIVQRVVHRHRGRVWAEASPDQGATFYFTLEKN